LAGVGNGETGLQLSLLVRHYHLVGSCCKYLTFAAGPSVALLSERLGARLPTITRTIPSTTGSTTWPA
jgi:hypothetical protein